MAPLPAFREDRRHDRSDESPGCEPLLDHEIIAEIGHGVVGVVCSARHHVPMRALALEVPAPFLAEADAGFAEEWGGSDSRIAVEDRHAGPAVRVDTEYVYTYSVFMNLTISIDKDVVRRARELARKRGVSLQQLLREYLESLVGGPPREDLADELFRIMDESPGRSGGRRFRREDAYEGRV